MRGACDIVRTRRALKSIPAGGRSAWSSRASCAASAANPAARSRLGARAGIDAGRADLLLAQQRLEALRNVLRRCENAAATTFA